MPHIALPDGLPGISSAFAFRPETAMRDLAEILLRGPSSLTSRERALIASFVSARNDCESCHASHRAAAAHNLGGDYEGVDAVRRDPQTAPVSPKLKALLAIAAKVRAGGRESFPRSRSAAARVRSRRVAQPTKIFVDIRKSS